MPGTQKQLLAPAGSTGNLTGTPVAIDADIERAAVEFVIEAIGATPQVTWKAQVSEDGITFFDAQYVTDAVDTVATAAITQNPSVVGTKIIFLRLADRAWKWVQIVVSANTNTTFRAEVYETDVD